MDRKDSGVAGRWTDEWVVKGRMDGELVDECKVEDRLTKRISEWGG